jgi:eukaryotic-like serine/threonine-protein kinase
MVDSHGFRGEKQRKPRRSPNGGARMDSTTLTDGDMPRYDSDDVSLDKLPPPYDGGMAGMARCPFLQVGAEPWPILPGFEILGVLGRGGMGTVYRARELHLQRMVAIKMLRSGEFADPDQRARFLREAQTLGGLQHPNIVQVFQGGEAHGQLYLVMECVDGGSLERRLKGSPLPPQTAAAVLEVLAGTMDYVHGRGVLHRDLKLANILVASDAEQPVTAQAVKITDFGLAKRFEKDQADTPSRALVGTPNYMAPEQASGQPASPASDVYALGAILYELLTGRPPFTGTTWMDTVQQVLTVDPVPPRRLHAKVPRDLETICLQCLRKEPGKRYPSPAALADDLQGFLAGQPIHARPATWWDRAAKWVRRRPAVAALLAALAAVTLCGIGLVTWKWREAVQANEDLVRTQNDKIAAREALVREQLENETKQKQADLARRRDYALSIADRAWFSNHPERCQDMLNLCPPDLRRWEWYFLRNRLHAGQTVLHADRHEVNYCAFSPDGSMCASGGGKSTDARAQNDVKLWDPATGKLLFTLTGHQGPVTWVAFHPRQNVLVSLSTFTDFAKVLRDPQAVHDPEGECILWDLAKRKPLATLPNSFGSGALSANGAYLAVAGADHRVHIWDCSTPWPWKEVAKLPPYPGLINQLAFHPEGKLLARAGLQIQGIERGELQFTNELKLWHTATGAEERTLSIPHVEISAISFHPGGRLLAWANGSQNTATLWDLTTDQPLRTFFGHAGTIEGLTFHAHGKWLATAGKDRTVKLWDVAGGEELHTLRGHTAAVQTVAFAPDKAKLARGLASGGADGTLRFWDPVHGQDPITLRGPALAVTQVGYAPDGRRIAARAAGGPIRIWDVATREILLTLDTQAERFVFSPDGKRLVTAGGNFHAPDQPGELIVWDADSGKRLHTFAGHTRHVAAVAWSANGTRIVSASGNPFKSPAEQGEVVLWDGTNYQQVLRWQPPIGYVSALQFSPDNRTLALATQTQGVHLVDASSGKGIRTLGGHTHAATCLAFSRDGQYLVSGDAGGTAMLWDVATGQRTLTFRTNAAGLRNLAFHPDGSRVATAAFDPVAQGRGGIQLWDTITGQEILTLPGQLAVTFSPDGHQLAGAAAGNLTRPGSVLIWEAPPTPQPR